MADLQQGKSMSEAFRFVTGGAAYTLALKFQPDMVEVYNLTTWKATAAGTPYSVWFRDQTTAAHAFQQQVIDSSAGASFNFLDTATNGFTVADTSGGSATSHALINAITQANPCVVTTTVAHGFQTGQIVRITDLGPITAAMDRGMIQLNNNRYVVVRVDATSFSLKDVISDEPINSTAFTAYVSGGRLTLETHVITINNPQSGSYTANAFAYDPIEYKLTMGTAIMGTDGDEYLVVVRKFGQVTELGDIG